MLRSAFAIPLVFLASLALSLVLRGPLLDADIVGTHNWRQSQTMWNVRNFVRYDNNILNTRVSNYYPETGNLLRYEFPVMQWGIAQLQSVLGEEIWVARLSVFAISAVGLLGFFLLLRVMTFPPWVALLGTIALQFSPLLYFYSINILPDLLALSAVIWYLYFVFSFLRGRRMGTALAAGACLGLATLAKLPYAMYGIVGLVLVLRQLFARRLTLPLVVFALGHLLFLLPSYLWYSWVMPGWAGNPILTGIFGYDQDWDHNLAILRHHLRKSFPKQLLSPAVWLFAAVGVVWPLRLPVGRLKPSSGHPRDSQPPSQRTRTLRKAGGYGPYFLALAFVTTLYLVLQWDAIGVVHDYYLLPFLPWMYVVVTAGMGRLWLLAGDRPWRWVPRALVVLGVCVTPYAAYALYQGEWDVSRGYGWAEYGAAFAHRQELQQLTDDDDLVIVVNDLSLHIFTWLIRKRGYVYARDHFTAEQLAEHRRQGIRYLYSNSRAVDERPEIQAQLGRLVYEVGTVRVYELMEVEG